MIIKELMRHKSYQTTLPYVHLHPEYLTGKTEVLCSSRRDLDSKNFVKNSTGPDLDLNVQNSGKPKIQRIRKTAVF